MLVSTHDLDLAARCFDQVVLLNTGLISSGTPAEVFRQEHLQAAFGGQMVVVDGVSIFVDQCCGGHDRFGAEQRGGHTSGHEHGRAESDAGERP